MVETENPFINNTQSPERTWDIHMRQPLDAMMMIEKSSHVTDVWLETGSKSVVSWSQEELASVEEEEAAVRCWNVT